MDNPAFQKVDRLVLHQSSSPPSLSSSSQSDCGILHYQKAKSFGVSPGLQRPETSRGRSTQPLDGHLEKAEPALKKEGLLLAEEISWEIQKEKEKEEEDKKKRAEKEQRSLRESEKEKVNREAEQAMEEEKELMLKEKEKRMHLLRAALRREEEEEERKLREESKERLK